MTDNHLSTNQNRHLHGKQSRPCSYTPLVPCGIFQGFGRAPSDAEARCQHDHPLETALASLCPEPEPSCRGLPWRPSGSWQSKTLPPSELRTLVVPDGHPEPPSTHGPCRVPCAGHRLRGWQRRSPLQGLPPGLPVQMGAHICLSCSDDNHIYTSWLKCFNKWLPDENTFSWLRCWFLLIFPMIQVMVQIQKQNKTNRMTALGLSKPL